MERVVEQHYCAIAAAAFSAKTYEWILPHHRLDEDDW